MRFKALAGVLGIVSASCLWASHGKPWELLPSFRSNGALSSAAREDHRESERLRRSESPSLRVHRGVGRAVPTLTSDGQLTHATVPLQEKSSPVSPCRHVEIASPTDSGFHEAFQVHRQTVDQFVQSAGFGFERVINIQDLYGRDLPLASVAVERAELVSLLVHDDPAIYEFHSPNDPSQPRVERRPLDPFEELALDHVRQGANLVYTKEQPDRMFGAIRATADCIGCHTNAKENDLLGAFSYRLKSQVPDLETIASR